jgi:hypothetical protein
LKDPAYIAVLKAKSELNAKKSKAHVPDLPEVNLGLFMRFGRISWGITLSADAESEIKTTSYRMIGSKILQNLKCIENKIYRRLFCSEQITNDCGRYWRKWRGQGAAKGQGQGGRDMAGVFLTHVSILPISIYELFKVS